MLQNPCKTLGFKKNMVYKIPPGGGGKPYPASGLNVSNADLCFFSILKFKNIKLFLIIWKSHFPVDTANPVFNNCKQSMRCLSSVGQTDGKCIGHQKSYLPLVRFRILVTHDPYYKSF